MYARLFSHVSRASSAPTAVAPCTGSRYYYAGRGGPRLPANRASRQLLAKVGFHEEGLARRYLRINNAWEDHVLFGILREDGR